MDTPLPNGRDPVGPTENDTPDGELVTIPRPVERGAFVRPGGEDVRVGDVVVEAGETISAAEVGLLAALGHARVRVHRRPRAPCSPRATSSPTSASSPGRARSRTRTPTH